MAVNNTSVLRWAGTSKGFQDFSGWDGKDPLDLEDLSLEGFDDQSFLGGFVLFALNVENI